MDQKRLSEIRKRHAATTRGPWAVDDADVDPPATEVVPFPDGSCPGIATVWPTESRTAGVMQTHLKSGTRKGNAEFIAHSWRDVRDLLDALTEANGDVAAMGDAIRLLEDALVNAEARLEELGYIETAKRCDTAMRQARALTKKRTPTEAPSST